MPKSTATAPRGASATAEDFALAQAALLDITTADAIGEPSGSVVEEDGTLTVFFDTTMPGYRGWRWTVSLAHVKGFSPSVLETELTPGEGALLSPDWVPWSERLAEYKEAQAALAAEEAADGSEEDDFDDDGDDDDDGDEDDGEDDDALLHGGFTEGDVDGVDIDSLDEADAAEGAEAPTAAPTAAATASTAGRKAATRSKKSVAAAAPAVGDDEAKEAKGKSDDAGPQPPVKARRNQRSKKQQQHDEGE